MSKEEIIEEIKLNAVDIIFNREAEWSDKLGKVIDLWLSKAIDQTREETIREVEESLPKAQKITQKDWLGLDYTLGDVKYREHAYRLLVLDILNKLKK